MSPIKFLAGATKVLVVATAAAFSSAVIAFVAHTFGGVLFDISGEHVTLGALSVCLAALALADLLATKAIK